MILMVALSPSLLNESYIEPSRYDWLRSRAPVPTTYAPACEPLAEFEEVLENRTSRARGVLSIRIEMLVVSSETASSCVVAFWETRWIEHNGEAFDSRIGQLYLRARWYDGHRFTTLDPYAGNASDPLSFNKFGFVHANPITGIDPRGWDFTVAGIKVSSIVKLGMIGAVGGVALNALRNNALNRPWYEGALKAAGTGAILLPLMVASPELAVLMVLYGLADSMEVAYQVYSDPNTSIEQRVYAALYVAVNIFFARSTARAIEVEPPLGRFEVGVIRRPNMKWRQVKDQNGKDVNIYGQESSSSTTPGHAYTIEALAQVLANTGRYVNILLQRSYRTATDRANPSKDTPDLIAETRDGKFDIVEVRSQSQTSGQLSTKVAESVAQMPPEMVGRSVVIEPITSGIPKDPFAQ
jgi:RHS repeat-associated protein